MLLDDPSANRYVANGSTTDFAYTFKILSKQDLDVSVDGVAKTVDTDYTVSGVGNATGGTVTMLATPTNGAVVAILRNQPATQASTYTLNEAFPSTRVEQDLDQLAMQIQELREKVIRALAFSKQSTLTDQAVDDPTTGLFARAKVGGGIDWASVVAAGSISVPVSIAEGGTGAVTAAAGRTALDVPSTAETMLDTLIVAKGDVLVGTAPNTPAVLTIGTNTEVLTADSAQTSGMKWAALPAASTSVAGVAELATQAEVNAMTDALRIVTPNHNTIVAGTPQVATSGTSLDFTGIPAGVRRIILALIGVSLNGAGALRLQLGDAGGLESSGYVGATATAVATISLATGTSGVDLPSIATAAMILSGTFTLTLVDPATNTWAITVNLGRSDGGGDIIVGGYHKATSQELTQLRLTTVAGSATFDAGAVNIVYER